MTKQRIQDNSIDSLMELRFRPRMNRRQSVQPIAFPIRDKLKGTTNELDLDESSSEEDMKALDEYKMFSPEELTEFEKEIPMPQ